jgi:hypothetical protein
LSKELALLLILICVSMGNQATAKLIFLLNN